MNPDPPLAYESSKTVLKHLNANSRISLFISCPSIRSAEKAVPLKIKKLEFADQYFIVDGMRYKVGIYKKYPEGMCPPSVEEKNEDGGWRIDSDHDGFDDWPSRLTLRPGDVDLRDDFERYREYPEVDRDQIKEKEKELPELEKRLGYVESLGPINPHFDLSYKQIDIDIIFEYFMERRLTTDHTSHFKVRKEFEHARARAYKELKNKVLDTKAILQQWYARRDGLPVPFESYITFTISNDKTKEKKTVEFVKYGKSLFEALNYLMHRIFENRRCPVAVKLLIPQSDILRLTPGLRMQVEGMHFDGEVDRAFAELTPYIEESSYPLEKLKIPVYDTEVFQHPKLRSAKQLVVVGTDGDIEWLPYFLKLENHKVHLINECDEEILSVADYMRLIKRWISSEKEEGASFSFSLDAYDDLEMDDYHKKVFMRIKKTFKKSVSGRRYAKIPTDNDTILKVSVEPSGEEEYPWNIVLQILPSEGM
ncbi:hypothetical protein GCK72_004342 [Caenorhabditis remanei]|uniref:Uncharacterized protein n=1 Tax=Caenorhabditis remanei TaxID=31234 RepID=A0A6A5HB01_CAERE|nr:hypothetical protein GCK72_004342 [Caenorhabditis remanei]KAF1764395.1 hypothetical protein GCK72_004342 [Caenorhabditis remanei]